MSTSADNRPHVVVLGAGFAGLTFAQRFPDGLARVTLVDRTNHHLFQPLLYQVATAGLAVPDIAQPVRSILAKKRDVTVLMDEVTGFDLAKRTVRLSHGELAYDHLVVALGGRTSYFGHPEWEQHAPGLKTIDDAIRIRRNVLHAFERAEMTDDPAERQRLMTVVVIGGGPTGVELAGTFSELQRHVLARDFRRLNLRMARVILVEGSQRLLGAYPPELSDSARAQLESLGVAVWVGAQVKDIRAGEVVLPNETLRAANIIWGAGVAASPLGAQLGAETDRAGRVKVLPDLSIPGHPEVRVLGDMIALTDPKGQVVPGVSPAAMQAGTYVARQLALELRAGAPADPAQRAPFVYFDKGSMATIGRSRAVAKIGKLQFSGFSAWLAWLFIHLVFLVGFRNKLSVLLSWTYSYLTFRRGARVIYGFPAAGERVGTSAR
ncbi:MAG TPA: NAD(P)/FAD-dependent oxidoreductase [Opitutaceae bacterium]|nr:NAD(P)/FAD-dependent oxidoreductase [Opitutaceae bacterium]